ncbi:MAG: hypothetical protein NT157_04315 [Candidatus Micrarchaeota archaeon]|nr:hypothetical protein [Candidatus Micrarchaeota archaeon]
MMKLKSKEPREIRQLSRQLRDTQSPRDRLRATVKVAIFFTAMSAIPFAINVSEFVKNHRCASAFMQRHPETEGIVKPQSVLPSRKDVTLTALMPVDTFTVQTTDTIRVGRFSGNGLQIYNVPVQDELSFTRCRRVPMNLVRPDLVGKVVEALRAEGGDTVSTTR